eukprot:168076-Pleurochrysis_carterae.AAC.1
MRFGQSGATLDDETFRATFLVVAPGRSSDVQRSAVQPSPRLPASRNGVGMARVRTYLGIR